MGDTEYSLKEILEETRIRVESNFHSYLELKSKYDMQSTSIYEKSKEIKVDVDSLGKKVTGIEKDFKEKLKILESEDIKPMDKRVRNLEFRIYAATVIILGLAFLVNNFWGKV